MTKMITKGEGVLTLSPTVPQSEKKFDGLDKEVPQLHDAGRYVEALSVAERYIASARKEHGEDHPAFATALSSLIRIYVEQGKSSEAEPLAPRALAIREKRLGSSHSETASSLIQLAEVLSDQGRPAEAAPLEVATTCFLRRNMRSCSSPVAGGNGPACGRPGTASAYHHASASNATAPTPTHSRISNTRIELGPNALQ